MSHVKCQLSHVTTTFPPLQVSKNVMALQSPDRNTATSVEENKIQQLLQCSPSRWKFGMLQSSGTCKMVLQSCKWDLERAVMVVTKTGRDSGLNHTQVRK